MVQAAQQRLHTASIQETPRHDPPRMTAIDVEMARMRGTTIAVEATQEHLQASKTATTPSLTDIIAAKERLVGRLRCELHFERESRILGDRLAGDLQLLIERCNMAVEMYEQDQRDIKAGYSRFKAGLADAR
ncbi:hypothetical protein E8E12_000423 [Didymella heteroderae]|uniref:Uncharacterized protein n=1 Tax=Didymella heteroderae TaxID=1769908 RepID=A0A9P4WG23_9PLEO|nr:hypothetical protein E8E12_000423 [Didymella heteroderae]